MKSKRTDNFFIVVNPVGSKFAKSLQQGLKEKINGKVFRVSENREGRSCFVVTQRSLNKIQQLQRFVQAGVSAPRFAVDKDAARELDVRTLFARTLVNSTNGRGIVEFDSSDADYPEAPLYTEYIPKRSEYRFHVFNGEVIDVQEKRKKRGFDGDRDTRIRNVNNGYVYCRDGVNPPDGAADLAVRAVQALGYHYGAVDVIYNEKRNQSYVLEVNSRPGLQGTTLERYVKVLIKQFNLKVTA